MRASPDSGSVRRLFGGVAGVCGPVPAGPAGPRPTSCGTGVPEALPEAAFFSSFSVRFFSDRSRRPLEDMLYIRVLMGPRFLSPDAGDVEDAGDAGDASPSPDDTVWKGDSTAGALPPDAVPPSVDVPPGVTSCVPGLRAMTGVGTGGTSCAARASVSLMGAPPAAASSSFMAEIGVGTCSGTSVLGEEPEGASTPAAASASFAADIGVGTSSGTNVWDDDPDFGTGDGDAPSEGGPSVLARAPTSDAATEEMVGVPMGVGGPPGGGPGGTSERRPELTRGTSLSGPSGDRRRGEAESAPDRELREVKGGEVDESAPDSDPCDINGRKVADSVPGREPRVEKGRGVVVSDPDRDPRELKGRGVSLWRGVLGVPELARECLDANTPGVSLRFLASPEPWLMIALIRGGASAKTDESGPLLLPAGPGVSCEPQKGLEIHISFRGEWLYLHKAMRRQVALSISQAQPTGMHTHTGVGTWQTSGTS